MQEMVRSRGRVVWPDAGARLPNGEVSPGVTSRTRDRRQPAAFVRPCQPVVAREIPTGSALIRELK